MPRPKRTKVAASRPAPRVAKSRIASRAPTDPIEDIYGVSDPIEESTARGRPSNEQHVISETRARRAVKTTLKENERGRALEHTRRKRDLAMGRLEAENFTSTTESDVPLPSTEHRSSSPAIEVGRRAPPDDSVFALGDLGRRPRQPSILGRGRAGRSSSMESNLAYGIGHVHAPKRTGSVLPTQEIGLRRRVRQPSILGRGTSQVRSSSIGMQVQNTPLASSEELIDGFDSERPRGRDFEFEDNDEDDFNPDDESTPLNLSKTRLLVEQTSQSASSTSNSRKRRRTPPNPPSPLPDTINDIDVAIDTMPSSEPFDEQPPHSPTRISTPEPLSETMAPPRSSSPLAPEVSAYFTGLRQPSQRPPSTGTRYQPSRKQAPLDDSPPSSPPSLTHSPNLRPTRKTAPMRHTKPALDPTSFTTAQLQNLLPRRRHRAARDPLAFASDDEAEIDTAGLGSDDDELTHLSIAPGRMTHRTPAPGPASTRRVTKFKAAKKGKGKGTESGSRRVYGTRTADSDKENTEAGRGEEEENPDHSLAPLPDTVEETPENSQEMEARVGQELKRAKRKFEDVDKWELEFEDATASSSSPRDAR